MPNPLEDQEVLELIQAQTDTVVRIASQSIKPVNNRLSQLISAPRNSLANNSHQGIQLSIEDPTVNSTLSQTGLISGLNSSADIFNNGWAIWTDGSVVIGKGKGGTDFHIDGITAGIDKRITPLLTAGLALRVAQEDSDVGVASSIDTDSYSATAYGSYALNENTYIQSAIGYSDIDISSKRISNTDVFEGNRDASQVYMSLSLTRQFEYEGLTLLPYGSFDGSYSTLDSYSETGSNLALTYHEQDIKAFAATIGLRGKYFIEHSYRLFVPRFHVNYQGDIKSDTDVSVNYVSTPSTTFNSSFDANSSSSWLFGLGIDYQYNNLNFSADYERTQEINWGYSDTFRLMLNATF
ncbi:MAG: autotransporter outer membrane beta-barrel domain-containing protein [Proteobacteria bacterium]|nr:autotransporter outer membrane beta-barrel domain-containing protein [Pseudomonadota bacterium]